MSKDPSEVTFVGPRASRSHKRKKRKRRSKEAEAKLKCRPAAKKKQSYLRNVSRLHPSRRFEGLLKQLLCHVPAALRKPSHSG